MLGAALGGIGWACTALTGVDDLTPVQCQGACDGAADAPFAPPEASDVTQPMDAPTSTDVDGGADARFDVGVDARADAGVDAPTLVPIDVVQASTTKPTAAITTLPFMAPVDAHDAIIVCLNYPIADAGVTLVSLTDTLGNSYAVVVGPVDGSNNVHYVAVALDSGAGADTLTLTLSGATNGGSDLLILEYSGLALANAFDVSAWASGSSTATDGMQSGHATTTAAHELILGYAEGNVASAGTGFMEHANQSNNVTEDRVVDAVGSYQAVATSTSGAWTMIMATFRGQ
jgi:hypothetical protein